MSVREFNYTSPDVQSLLARPGAMHRLRAAIAQGLIHPQVADELIRDLDQFDRVEEGSRQRADLYSPDRVPKSVANQQDLPDPFSKRETHRPDRTPGTAQHAALSRIHSQLTSEYMTEDLQERMGTDSQRPPDPPSLRDAIEAAASIHAPEEN